MNTSSNLSIKRIALIVLIIIFSLTIVFHLLILTGIIPFGIVWGGRITSQSQMYLFELVSIFINVIFLFIVLLKSRLLKLNLPEIVLNIGLWVMVIVFLLNTFGNLLSNNHLEKLIFTPITILLSLLGLIVVLKKD